MTITSLSNSSAIAQIARGTLNKTAQVSQADTQQDSVQVSDLGKLMKQLQNLQQSDPDKFKQTTAQIASKLEAAASQAADSGDSQQAGALNDLASKFKTASETGEMPDLRPSGNKGGAHGASGHHGGPPPMGPPPDDDDDSLSTSSSSATTTTGATSQALDAYLRQSSDPVSVLDSVLQDVFSSATSSSGAA